MVRRQPLTRTIPLLAATAVALTTSLAACGTSDSASGESPGSSAQVIRVAMPSEGPDDLGLWPAIEALEAKGIEVKITQFAEQEQTISAMLDGNVDVTINLALSTTASAIGEGAPVHVIAGYTKNSMVLASPDTLSSATDLEGGRVGVHSETSLTKALADWYLKNENVEAEVAIVPGSDVRAQALSKGQLEAAVVSLTDYATLIQQDPGKFHTLADFSQELPDLMVFTTTASDEWVESNPDLAEEFVAALVGGNQKIQTMDGAMPYASKHYANFVSTPELLEEQVRLLVEGGYFPTDGQLTESVCADSLTFLAEAGQLDPELAGDPDQVCRYDVIGAALGQQ